MYLVSFKPIGALFSTWVIQKFETLDEAKDFVKELYSRGQKEVILSQEIPMKVTVSVEF